MDEDEQYLFWALLQDVNTHDQHCAQLANGLYSLYWNHPDKVRVYSVETDPNTRAFTDPETNTVYIREDRFTWAGTYSTLPHEGDHFGNHHVHEEDITWIRDVQGWADAVPKTSFHFTSEVQESCINW
jgi:hypothetical protein